MAALVENDENYFLQVVKGFLILCVIIEHNHLIESVYPNIKILLESFDVFGFFLIAFYYKSYKFSYDFIKTRAIRYLVPYFWFYTVSSILNHIMVNEITIFNYLLGLIISSPPLIKQSSGFSYFWFLPTLFILVAIRSIYTSNKHLGYFILLISILFHFFSSNHLRPYALWIPYNISAAFFCFPICILFEKSWPLFRRIKYLQILSLIIWVISLILISCNNSKLFLFANLFPSIRDPIWLIVHGLCVLSLLPSFYFLVGKRKYILLALIGKYSLGVYLFHNLTYNFLIRIFVIENNLTNIIVFSLLTVSISLIATMIIYKIYVIKKVIFPRNYIEFMYPFTWLRSKLTLR